MTCYKQVPVTEEKTCNYTVMVPEDEDPHGDVQRLQAGLGNEEREYTVCVPYTETVEKKYTVCVPYTETVEKKYTVCVPK